MTDGPRNGGKREAQAIGALIGGVIEPVCAKRGFATADLIGAWDEIVGPRYAGATQPEKIVWPRRDSASAKSATLVVRVDAGMAIYLQHEIGLVLQRINSFLGFEAIGTLRIIQGPVERPRAPTRPAEPSVSPAAARAIGESLAEVESETLRAALERLGRQVYGAVSRS